MKFRTIDTNRNDLTLEELYLLYEDELYDYVLRQVKDKFEVFTGVGKMYIACFPKENAGHYPVFCSHLDVKYNVPPRKVKVEELDGRMVHKGFDFYDFPFLLGADDRNGVRAMLELIKNGYTSYGYVFAKQEEEGRHGARALVRDRILQMKRDELGYFVMLDCDGTNKLGFREIKGDAMVSTLHQNRLFIEKLTSFEGFILEKDGISDYIEYCLATQLCGINLSVGFMNQHKTEEYSDIEYVKSLPQVITRLADHLGEAQYPLNEGRSKEEKENPKHIKKEIEMKRTPYETITYMPYEKHVIGDIKGQYIEIFVDKQKVTGIIMEREFRSVIVDITSPYWNASRGIVTGAYLSNEFYMNDRIQEIVAKDLLRKLYLDCKHAYENADPSFWENEEYSKFYLRDLVPYEKHSGNEKLFGPQVSEEERDLYLESRKHITWPNTSFSYMRERLDYIRECKQIEKRDFPDSKVWGNLVEITCDGQRVQGEIITRKLNDLAVRIRYPYDGFIEKVGKQSLLCPYSKKRYKGYNYEGGELAAKKLLRTLYLRGQMLEEHLDEILTAHEEYTRLMAIAKSRPGNKKAAQELEIIYAKMSKLRRHLREGLIDIEDYRKIRASYKQERFRLRSNIKVDKGAIFNEAFKNLQNKKAFRQAQHHIFQVAENPEIITGKHALNTMPSWFSLKTSQFYKY